MAISLPDSLRQVAAAGPLADNDTGNITAAVLRAALQRIIEEIQTTAGADNQATQAAVYELLKDILSEGSGVSLTEADDSSTIHIAADIVFPAWSAEDTYVQGQPVFHSGGVYVARQDIEMASNTGPDVDRANWITTTTYRGDYSAAHYYDEGQIVKDDDGNFYAARASRSPSATKPQDDAANWANLTDAGGGLAAVATDATIAGTGEAGSPLSVANPFTDADEAKLDGIAAGAEVNVQADWDATSGDAQILNKPTIPVVPARAGAFSAADEAKLDGIEANATADQTAGEIVGLIEGLSGSARLDAASLKNLPSGGGAVAAGPLQANPITNLSAAYTGSAEQSIDLIDQTQDAAYWSSRVLLAAISYTISGAAQEMAVVIRGAELDGYNMQLQGQGPFRVVLGLTGSDPVTAITFNPSGATTAFRIQFFELIGAKGDKGDAGEGGLTVLSGLPDVAAYAVDDLIVVDDGPAAGIYLARPAANDGKFAGTIGTSEVAANSLQLHFTENPNGALRLLQWTSAGDQIFFLVNRANIAADPGTLYLQIERADGNALSNSNRNQSRFTAFRATEYDTSTDWAYYVTVDGSTQTRWAALSQNQTATIGIYSDSAYSTEWIAALSKHWQRIAADAAEFAAIKTEVERLERELSPEWADPPTQDQIDAGWAFATNPATSGTPGTASPLDAAYITGTYTAVAAIQTRMFLRAPNDADPNDARIQLQDNLTAYYPLGNYGWTKITAPSDGDETAYDYYILESNGESTQFGMISGDTMTLQTLQDFVALYGRVNMAEQGLAALRTALTALQSQANDNTTSIQTNTNNIGNRLTQSQVDARIISTARAGNTARWPKNKLPDDIVYDADANAGFLERVVTLTGVVTQPAADQNGVLFNSNATTRRTVTFQTDSINYPDGYRVAIRASNTGEVVVNQTVSSTTSHLFTLQRDQIVILIKEPGRNNFVELDNSEEIDQKARDAIERLQDLTHDIHAGPGVPDDWRQANALVAEIANRETVWNLNDARAQTAYSLFAASSGDQRPKYVLIKLDHSADIRRFRLELTSLNDDSASPTHIQLTELDVVGNSLPVNGVIQFKYYTDFGAPVVPHGFIAALQQAYGTNETGQSTYSGILDGSFRVEEYPSLAGSFIRISQTDYEALPDAVKENGKIYSIYDPDAPTAAPGRPAFLREESAGADEIVWYFGPSNTGGRVQYYEWRVALQSASFRGNWNRIAAHSGEFVARGLSASTNYKAQLRAGNAAGNSPAITDSASTIA